MMESNKEKLEEKINKQEEKDRYIAIKCLNELLENKNKKWKIKATPTTCPTDLKATATTRNNQTITFEVEIKERIIKKNSTSIYNQHAALRADKLRRMNEECGRGSRLFYMVLLNREKMLLFDLDKIDFMRVPVDTWTVKKTELDENSEYVSYPIYQIPFEYAIKEIDIKEYYEEYYERQKEELSEN